MNPNENDQNNQFDITDLPIGGVAIEDLPIGGEAVDASELPVGGEKAATEDLPVGGINADELPVGGYIVDDLPPVRLYEDEENVQQYEDLTPPPMPEPTVQQMEQFVSQEAEPDVLDSQIPGEIKKKSGFSTIAPTFSIAFTISQIVSN